MDAASFDRSVDMVEHERSPVEHKKLIFRGVPLPAVVLLCVALVVAVLVVLWHLGSENVREGVDDVATSLRQTISNNVQESIREFLAVPFSALETLTDSTRVSFNIERADGFELHGDRFCTGYLQQACRTYPSISGFFLGTENGHFCSASCPQQGADLDTHNWTISTIPPMDQIRRGVPTWTIPCRYRSDCSVLYSGRPDYQAHCEPADPWQGEQPCDRDQFGCRPYWASGQGPQKSIEAYPFVTPDHATWAVAVNPQSSTVTTCRGLATGPKPPCDDVCGEYNRTYYKTDSTFTWVEYGRSITNYDPRSRGWYKEIDLYPLGTHWYTPVYVCASSGLPCFTACKGIYRSVPAVGATVVRTGGFDLAAIERGVVLEHRQTMDDMASVRVEFPSGVADLPAQQLRLACESVEVCISERLLTRPDDCRVLCAKETGAVSNRSLQYFAPKRIGVVIADYESWTLKTILEGIKVGKTGGLFITEKDPQALLIGSGMPCAASLRGRQPEDTRDPQCFVTADNKRVSAFDPYAGSLLSGIMHKMYNPVKVEGADGVQWQGTGHQGVTHPETHTLTFDGAKYWVDVIPITGQALGVENVDWLVFLILPQDDYMSDIVERERTTLIVSLVLVGFIAVVLTLLSTLYIARPLKNLVSDFDNACSMQLDGILQRPRARWYPLREVGHLQETFVSLVSILSVYKSYLPESVLCEVIALSMDEQQRQPPAGRVAIVFTDIESSTSLWEQCPEGMSSALAKHNQMFRKLITKHNGYEVKTIGDAFMVTFDDSLDAAAFCLDAQLGLVDMDWSGDIAKVPSCEPVEVEGNLIWNGLRVRLGAHVGYVEQVINPITGRADYAGPTVNRAARIESLACGGLIAVSDELYQDVQGKVGHLKAQVIDLGLQNLKGCREPIRVHGLVPTRLKARAPHLQVGSKQPQPPQPPPRRKSSATTAVSSPPSPAGSVGLGTRQPRPMLDSTMKPATVTIAASQVNIPQMPPDSISAKLNTVLSSLEEASSRTEGVFLGIVGSCVITAWNTVNHCAAHTTHGIRFASLAQSLCEGMLLTLAIGITTGKAMYGNVQGVRRRHHTVAGNGVVEMAMALARGALSLQTNTLLVSLPGAPSAVQDPSMEANLRPVDMLTTTLGDRIVVYELRITEKTSGGVWNFLDDHHEDNEDNASPTLCWCSPSYHSAFTRVHSKEKGCDPSAFDFLLNSFEDPVLRRYLFMAIENVHVMPVPVDLSLSLAPQIHVKGI